MAPTTLFEVGVLAHAGAARGEMVHLLEEFRARVAPGGAATPTIDSASAYVTGDRPPLPQGSRDEPVRWGGVAALGAAVTAPFALWRLARRRR